MKKELLLAGALTAIVVSAWAWQMDEDDEPARAPRKADDPVLQLSPLSQDSGSWKITTADRVHFQVTAPGAKKVTLRYAPVSAQDRYIELKTVSTKADPATGRFEADFGVPSDFAGDVWAVATYPSGAERESDPIPLMKLTSAETGTPEPAIAAPGPGSSPATESAHSDRANGGRIQHADFQAGNPNVRITVNVPAFKLTLWQDGKEVKTYQIGVGMKKFPIAIGHREATEVIFNPAWIPPDSDWVRESKHYNVKPGEVIDANDPRNPLGKIKIPLGNAYLIHEAASRNDIGRLVSHGCVRMLPADIQDLAEKLVAAKAPQVSADKIQHAETTTARLDVPFKTPVPVDISYDTEVVEGGVLHLYPDVYDRGTRTIQAVRQELAAAGVASSDLDDAAIKQMMDRVTRGEEFAVSLNDLREGRGVEAGANQSLRLDSPEKKKSSRRAKLD